MGPFLLPGIPVSAGVKQLNCPSPGRLAATLSLKGRGKRGRRRGELQMAEQMTGAEMVIEALSDQGVEHIFGYPGGAALPIYDALFQQDKVQHILVRHEQGAGHMAEGYA